MLMTVMLGDGGLTTPTSGPSSMTVEVDAERLFSTAHRLESTARQLAQWLDDHGDRFVVEPAGRDVVSNGISDFFDNSWSGPDGGLKQIHLAIKHLQDFAKQLRASAESYGLTESGNTASLCSNA